MSLRGEVRNIASARNLERISDQSDRFHRVFRGEHVRTRDKILLHIYDLSASDDPNADRLASRQCETLQKLQKSSYVPRLMDSFQEVPQYPGELWYFSIVDPCAPSVAERAPDARWAVRERIFFALRAVQALEEMHGCRLRDTQFVHRHITPNTLLVGAGDQPIFTGFDLARISGSITLSPNATLRGPSAAFAAPEAILDGIGGADQRSDVFSLCKTLLQLFPDSLNAESANVASILESGIVDAPDKRVTLRSLANSLSQSLSEEDTKKPAMTQTTLLAARFWSEGDLVAFNNEQYIGR